MQTTVYLEVKYQQEVIDLRWKLANGKKRHYVTRIVTTLRFCFSIVFWFFSMCTPDAFLFHKCSTISE